MERKEAIEIVRKLYNESLFMKKDKEAMVTLIPELKESEGEKIRKEIIEYIKTGTYHKDWLAWLEKQGEQKLAEKVEPKFKIDDYIERKDGLGCHAKIIFVGGNVYGCEKLIHSEDESPFFEFMFKNQDEFQISSDFKQKPADEVEPKFKVGQTIKKEGFNLGFTIVKIEDGFYYNDMGDHFPFTDQDNWKLVEQNSTWSEEDEDILNTIINHFKVDIECTDEDDMVRWLKSLKDRVQPKQEWSEEDEKILNSLISSLARIGASTRTDSTSINYTFSKEIDWLKSLRPQNWTKEDKERYTSCLQRLGTGNPKQPETINSKWFKEHVYPQPTWKPSDEQIEALKGLLELINKKSMHGREIVSLLEHLKKLREE